MADVLVLAVAAAIYPTLLAIVILILSRPHPVRLLAGFLIGGMATSIVVGLVLLSVLEGSGVLEGSSGRSVGPGVDLAVGALSLLIAALLAGGRELPFAERRARRQERRRADEPRDPWTKRVLTRDSIWLAFALGIVLDLPSVWYLAALKEIAAAGNGVALDLVAVLIFNLIMFTLVELPLLGYLLAPETSAARVARFDAWMRSHARRIGAAVAGVIGLYLLLSGIVDLT